MDVPTFQSRLSAMPVRAQYTLQQALAGLAAQAPDAKPDKPMLLKLAEHVAIRFALDSYEKGELRVNAVKQLLDRMNTEIEALRKILSTQEEMMSQAGLSVQSYTELLDQEFWEQVPEENKKEVLTSDEAWCVPPRNVRAFLEDMLRRGELKTVNEILMKYASCVGLEAQEAMRSGQIADGMMEILNLMPKATVHYVTNRFGHCGFREDCDLLTTIIRNLGEDATQRLLDTLQTAPAAESAEAIGLVSQLSPENVEKILPARLSQWPRSSHDRPVRPLSAAPPDQRARLLMALYDSLDVLIRPLAIE